MLGALRERCGVVAGHYLASIPCTAFWVLPDPLLSSASCLIKSSCRCRESQNNLSRLGLGLCTLTRTWTRKYRGFTFSVHTRLRRPDCTVQNEMLAR